MTIQMVNGYPVYAVTKKEVAYHPSRIKIYMSIQKRLPMLM